MTSIIGEYRLKARKTNPHMDCYIPLQQTAEQQKFHIDRAIAKRRRKASKCARQVRLSENQVTQIIEGDN